MPFVQFFDPLRIYTMERIVFVNMYYCRPILLVKSSIAKQNACHGVNVISDGSPSRMRRVRRISLGMTTLPRSSPCVNIFPKINYESKKC